MKITQDVREYAKEQNVEVGKALAVRERLKRQKNLSEAKFIKAICLKVRRIIIKVQTK